MSFEIWFLPKWASGFFPFALDFAATIADVYLQFVFDVLEIFESPSDYMELLILLDRHTAFVNIFSLHNSDDVGHIVVLVVSTPFDTFYSVALLKTCETSIFFRTKFSFSVVWKWMLFFKLFCQINTD